mgnify:CR=1 FL=1
MSNQLFDIILAREQARKKTAKQQQIIEQAIRLFAEKGFANTSTAEIAKAAGVAEGTIFKHFGTKDQLLLSIIVPFLKEFFPDIAQDVLQGVLAEHPLSFEDFLRGLLRDRVAFLMANRDIFQVVIKEVLYRDELKQDLVRHIRQHAPQVIRRAVDMFQARGELTHMSSERVVSLLFTLVGGFIMTRLVWLEDFSNLDAAIDEIVDLAMNGLRGIEGGDKDGGHSN